MATKQKLAPPVHCNALRNRNNRGEIGEIDATASLPATCNQIAVIKGAACSRNYRYCGHTCLQQKRPSCEPPAGTSRHLHYAQHAACAPGSQAPSEAAAQHRRGSCSPFPPSKSRKTTLKLCQVRFCGGCYPLSLLVEPMHPRIDVQESRTIRHHRYTRGRKSNARDTKREP